MFNTIREDFSQECRCSTYAGGFRKAFHALTAPGFQAVFLFRLSHALAKLRIPLIPVALQRLNELWTGVSISPQTRIGPGLVIYHFGGIVINSKAVLGSHCELHHHVTIGNRKPGGASPVIGDRVAVGTGAVLIGDITVGDDAQIGANAVVLESVPAGGVAVGVPAKVVRVKRDSVAANRRGA
jgi:serine O-acetyltransferase